MTQALGTTPLHDWHIERGARMVDFAGWSMPVQYSSIIEEHSATRSAATLFDVSHMGRIRVNGAGAAQFLDRVLTRRVHDMEPGDCRYSLVLNDEGMVLDDVLAYYQEKPSGGRYHMLVVNASNREKIWNWLGAQIRPDDGVELDDRTLETAMVAVQGPKAIDIVNSLVDADIEKLGYYKTLVTQQMRKPVIVSRTGYTGEDGVELIIRDSEARLVVENIFRAGEAQGLIPAGLGARDTLRLEAAMPLYGHELSESISPLEVGLKFAIQTKDRDFVGKAALLDTDPQRKRIGLSLDGKRAPREGYSVSLNGTPIGEITSGTFSPTLNHPIAMALVARDGDIEVGSKVNVDIRGKQAEAVVTKLPFYKRPG